MLRSTAVQRRFISRRIGASNNAGTAGSAGTTVTRGGLASATASLFSSFTSRSTTTAASGGAANGGTVSMEDYNNGNGIPPATAPASEANNNNADGSNSGSTSASSTDNGNAAAEGAAAEFSSAERTYWLKTLLHAASTRFLVTGTDCADTPPNEELKRMQDAEAAATAKQRAAAFAAAAEAFNDPNGPAPCAIAGAGATSAAQQQHKVAEHELNEYGHATHTGRGAIPAPPHEDAVVDISQLTPEEALLASAPRTEREAEERKLYLSQITAPPMHLRRSDESGSGVPGTRMGSKVEQQIRRELRIRQPATSVNDLLNYNQKWASTIRKIDPTYFADLAKQQSPKFLWIGCADSRVPANQILGLSPGEVFVHRNVANVVSRSDLNCLSVVQYGVEHLRVEQLLVVGHYGCGGVTAAYKGLTLGLVDNWVSNVADIKHRNEAALARVPKEEHVDCLCDLNAITQALNVAESNVVQAHWRVFRSEDDDDETPNNAKKKSASPTKQPLQVHGWCYGLSDGLVHPLVDFGPYDDPRAKAEEAIEAAVRRRIEDYERRQRKPLVAGI